jgi:pimeloyl-ACP methyl ester carboxylesterase
MITITDTLAQMLPAASVSIVEGAGHCPIATHPDECAQILTAFVQQFAKQGAEASQ